jgi:hypothetical protein
MRVNRNIRNRGHPEALRPYLQDIEAFARHNHFNILHPVLRSAASFCCEIDHLLKGTYFY